MENIRRMSSLAGIFKFYDINEKSLIKIKSEENKSIVFVIPQSNFVVLNGITLGKDLKTNFSTYIV